MISTRNLNDNEAKMVIKVGNATENKGEVVLDPEMFEQVKVYHTGKMALAAVTFVMMSLFFFLFVFRRIVDIDFHWFDRSFYSTFVAVVVYLVVISPMFLLLMSCLFLSKSSGLHHLQKLIITQEATLILIKGIGCLTLVLQVQNEISRQTQALCPPQKQIELVDQETPSSLYQHPNVGGQTLREQSLNDTLNKHMDIKRKKRRNPTQTSQLLKTNLS